MGAGRPFDHRGGLAVGRAEIRRRRGAERPQHARQLDESGDEAVRLGFGATAVGAARVLAARAEIGGRDLAVVVARRPPVLGVKVAHPFVLRALRRVLGERQPHQAARPLFRHALADEQQMAEQRLGGVMALVGGERQPLRGAHVVALEARRAVHVHAGEIVLSVGIAEIGRRELEHLQRPFRIGLDLAVRYAVEAIDADGDEGVGDRRDVGPVGIVLVIAFDQALEIGVGLDVVARHAFAARVHPAELPLGERLAAVGGVGQRLDRGLGVAGHQVLHARLERLFDAGEGLNRDLGPAARFRAVERQSRRALPTEGANRQQDNGQRTLRISAAVRSGGSRLGHRPYAHSDPTSPARTARPREISPRGIGFRLFRRLQIARGLWRNRGTRRLESRRINLPSGCCSIATIPSCAPRPRRLDRSDSLRPLLRRRHLDDPRQRRFAPLLVLGDHLLGGAGEEIGVGELRLDLGDLALLLGDLLAEPRAFGGDVEDAGDRDRRQRAADDDLQRAGRRRGGEGKFADPRQAADGFGPPARHRSELRRRRDQRQRRLSGRRHAHFRAHRADFRDEVDHPADLRLGGRVDREAGARPRTERQHAVARRPGLAFDRPQLLGDERHERVQQGVDRVEDMGDRRLGLRLGRRRLGGLQHRLGEFEAPVAEHAPDEAIGGVGGVVEAIRLRSPRWFPPPPWRPRRESSG